VARYEVQTYNSSYLCFVEGASLYNLFQMKPTRCTIILSIFISTSLHISDRDQTTNHAE